MVKKSVLQGMFIGAFLVLAGLLVLKGGSVIVGNVIGSLNSEYTDDWVCAQWFTPCGLVNAPSFNYKGVEVNYTVVGCPLEECSLYISARKSSKQFNATRQLNTTVLQMIDAELEKLQANQTQTQ